MHFEGVYHHLEGVGNHYILKNAQQGHEEEDEKGKVSLSDKVPSKAKGGSGELHKGVYYT